MAQCRESVIGCQRTRVSLTHSEATVDWDDRAAKVNRQASVLN